MNLTTEQMAALAKENGFSAAVPLDPSTIRPLEEVRAMCASNHCHMYDKNWSCPPGCGTLEECRQQTFTVQPGHPCADHRRNRRFYGL